MSHRTGNQWRNLCCMSLLFFAAVDTVQAAVSPAYGINWTSGSKINTVAVTCTNTWPDNKPLQVPRTIQVDNSIPNGTVLYSWDYADFLPNFSLSCVEGTLNDKATTLTPYPAPDHYIYITPTNNLGFTVNGNPVPLQLKLYVRKDGSFPPCTLSGKACTATGYAYRVNNVAGTWPFGDEGNLNSTISAVGTLERQSEVTDSSNKILIGYPTGSRPSLSVRAELIKTGDFSPSMYGPAKSITDLIYVNEYSTRASYLSGTGITLVPAACRLQTKDYTIQMGDWSVTNNPLPAEGKTVPVALAMECNGALNNVRFMFQDAGSSPLSSGRISLYDSNNNKIDGLSVALNYNGTPVPVDGVTYFNAGAFGQNSPTKEFLPANDATFGAKYVQDKPGVTRSGINYSGAVSGKVNMFVTYN